jgi:hypothetical protein
MSKRLTHFTLIIFFAATTNSHAANPSAQVIFSSGPNGNSNGYELTERWGADDFQFLVNGNLSSMRFWATQRSGGWDGTLDYQILADASGSPGSILSSGSAKNIFRSPTGLPKVGGTEFEYTFDFSNEIPLVAGARYWVALHMKKDFSFSGPSNEMYWTRTDTIFGAQHHSTSRFGANPPWFADGAYSAFSLTLVVPEPNTLVLIMSSTILLILRRCLCKQRRCAVRTCTSKSVPDGI